MTDKEEGNKNRIIRIKMSDGAMITGQTNINRYSEYDRVSDMLAGSPEKFLVMFNVTISRDDQEKPIKAKSLFVHRPYIMWAIPEDGE